MLQCQTAGLRSRLHIVMPSPGIADRIGVAGDIAVEAPGGASGFHQGIQADRDSINLTETICRANTCQDKLSAELRSYQKSCVRHGATTKSAYIILYLLHVRGSI